MIEMLIYDKETAIMRRLAAFEFIKNDKWHWACWNDAKTESDRELIMSHVLWFMAFKAGRDYQIRSEQEIYD